MKKFKVTLPKATTVRKMTVLTWASDAKQAIEQVVAAYCPFAPSSVVNNIVCDEVKE